MSRWWQPPPRDVLARFPPASQRPTVAVMWWEATTGALAVWSRSELRRRWLSLVLYDKKMLELYAARVSGSLVLADHKRALVGALFRHLLSSGERRKRLLKAAA